MRDSSDNEFRMTLLKFWIAFSLISMLVLLLVVVLLFSKGKDEEGKYENMIEKSISDEIKNNPELLTGYAVHPVYSSFSSPRREFTIINNQVYSSDTVIYRNGYYSVNGSDWVGFNMTGNSYAGSSLWIGSSASYSLPRFGEGEHYIIIYSCTYNLTSGSWDCHDGKWQLMIINLSGDPCENVLCAAGEYCFEGVCLLEVPANTYFVSPDGNDSNPGNFTHPWRTWSKAFHEPHRGDIVYFRGGVYPTEVKDGTGIKYFPKLGVGNDGIASSPIRYFNYPGEVPIMDLSESVPSAAEPSFNIWNYGIRFVNAEYIHIKGLHMRNLYQRNRNDGGHDICFALVAEYCNHIKFENMEIYNIDGVAFNLGNSYYEEIINCDAYNNNDRYAATPGDYGMGFAASSPENFTEGYSYFYGCRAWNNTDMGFVSPTYSRVIFDNCWSFENGDENYPGGDGHGWKIGYWYYPMVHNDAITIRNSIAANNLGDGMAGNEHGFAYTSSYRLYNNFIYNNGRFGIAINNVTDPAENQLKRIAKNNIAYANDFININAEGLYTHSNNSWDSPVNVNDDDFVSLDVSQLYAPRKPDGSLPDITFGHLKEGSDLVDKGVNVGINYSGLAPDLGTFESSYSTDTCGNGNCDNGETCSNCEEDCGCISGYGCSSGTCINLGVQSLSPVWCGFHAIHTNYSDGTMNIYQSVNSLKNYYQCGSTNDHDVYPVPYNQTKWTETINLANEQNEDYNFTYFFGMEWSGGQHIHYITLNPSPTPKYVTDANFNTVAELAEWLSLNSGIAQINHPARTSGGTNFNDSSKYNETWIPLVEFKNSDYWHWNYYWNCSQNSGCTTYQNPYLPGESANATKWIKYALDKGIHLGFSCGSDRHGGTFNPACYTGIAARVNLTRQEIYNELKSRHTWVAEQKTVINLNVNNGSANFTMGDIFNTSLSTITISYIVNATLGNTVSSVNLFYNGVIVNVSNYTQQNIFGSITWPLTGNEEDYLFLEVIQSNGKRAWSSPIWATYREP